MRSKWINIKLDFSKELETQLEYLHTITKQPIKEFLLQHSYLVKFNQKNRTSQELNQREQAQQTRIYKLRGRAFNRIIQELSRYYQTVINGDYRFDGMPEIKHGISGWAEQKLWSLLVAIGEPNHVRYFAYCLLINLSLVFISRQ